MNTQTLLNNVATTTNNDAIIVNAKEFLKALRFVTVGVSTKKSRPTLMNIHVGINENELVLGATDSHKLTYLKVGASIPSELSSKEFLVDGKFAKNLSKTPTKHGEYLLIKPEFNSNGRSVGKVTFIDGNNETFIDNHGSDDFYPELERVIPDRTYFSFETRKKELLPVLKELKKFTNAKDGNVVRLEIQDNSGVVIGVDGDDSSIQEIHQKNLFIDEKHIVENDKGLNFEINFNLKYLIELVQKCDSTEFLKFSFSGTLRPFTFIRENAGIGEICPIRTY